MQKIVLAIAGLGGAIGSTIGAGLAQPLSRTNMRLGLPCESARIKKLNLNLVDLAHINLTGWDVENHSFYECVKKSPAANFIATSEAKTFLQGTKQRIGFKDQNLNEWLECEKDFLIQTKTESDTNSIVIVNLLPTEDIEDQSIENEPNWQNWKEWETPPVKITPSRIYFLLAILSGAHYVNFTPNIAETPNLCTMAEQAGILYSGRDGKTGQTFLKSVIAPAFRDRCMRVDGWFSTNILGNADGKALSKDKVSETKKISKSQCLDSILGYSPGGDLSRFSHQIQIHYYPPRGDNKEAWDNIDFSGYLDSPMQLKLNWLGQDSILAAPLVLDLARIVALAGENGEKGCLEEVAFFFKSPLWHRKEPVIHEFADQYDLLVQYLKRFIPFKKEGIAGVVKSITDHYRNTNAGLYLHASECIVPPSVKLAHSLHLSYRYSHTKRDGLVVGDTAFANTVPFEVLRRETQKQFAKLLRANWVSLNNLSGLNAINCSVQAIVEHGDTVFAVSPYHGGHPAIKGMVESRGATIDWIPFKNNMNIDWSLLEQKAKKVKPKLIMVNVSDTLISDHLPSERPDLGDALLSVDVSHVLSFYSLGKMKNLFDRGASILVGSTHKSFPGPHKGFIAANDISLSEYIEEKISDFISSDHSHHLLALWVAINEFEVFGSKFVEQCILNLQTFGAALESRNLKPVKIENNYGDSLQTWLPFPGELEARNAFLKLEKVGIYTNFKPLPFDIGWGFRIGIQEPTILGFEEIQIQKLAELIADILQNKITQSNAQKELSKIKKECEPLWAGQTNLLYLMEALLE